MPETLTKEIGFPKQGCDRQQLLQQLDEIKAGMFSEDKTKLSIGSLKGNEDIQSLVEQASNKFFAFNALFTFMEGSVGRIEDELLDMIVDLFKAGSGGRANLTTGGSESIYSAMKAMRDWARETRPHITAPEIVMPYSAHAAFSRGGKYFDIIIVRVPVAGDYRADVAAMAEAVSSNTIGIVGSAPCWPYGLYDRISELGELALAKNLWLHVDACVGGYLAPFVRKAGYPVPAFDFSVPGVRSMSADLHKYGYAPKPCSSILWRSEEEQQYHYTAPDDWPCGPYFTQSLVGSRPFSSTAAAWAVIRYLGEEGYVENARRIMEVKQRLLDGIAPIAGLRCWDTDLSLMVIEADRLDIQQVMGGMNNLGWCLLGNYEPPTMHLTVDPMSDEVIDSFISDLTEVMIRLNSGSQLTSGSLSYSGGKGGSYTPKWVSRALALIEKRKQSGNN